MSEAEKEVTLPLESRDAEMGPRECGALASLRLYYEKKDGCGHPYAGRVCVDCVAALLDEREKVVRLEEALWWEHLVGALHELTGREDCEPDCMYCARIAALRKGDGQ